MRQYELTVIYPLEEDQHKAGREAVVVDMEAHGVQVQKTDELGDRDLAYPIKKRARGRYVLYTISAEPASIVEIERSFKLNPNLLKFLFVRIEE